MDFWRIVIEAFLFAGGLFAFEKTILLSARAAEKKPADAALLHFDLFLSILFSV
jgi:hypothetical protein